VLHFSKVRILLPLISLLACAAGLSAQETDGRTRPASVQQPGVDFSGDVVFEITPHTGLMGGSGVFGLRLGMNYDALHLELAGEQVIGRTANLYPVSVNVLINLATRGRLIPYGAVGVGLFMTVPTTTIGDESVSTLGMNFGGGARYFLTDVFGVRAEVKQYMTSVNNSRDAGTTMMMFQEFSLGVTFLVR
jgi:hypothetical protein